mmetsp:Transcript_17081/g.42010  ORF Transcript_17081/g.42010 Transcript_17081/m.42010 type:complete len:246 (-) Transcript_17081:114-851(-)
MAFQHSGLGTPIIALSPLLCMRTTMAAGWSTVACMNSHAWNPSPMASMSFCRSTALSTCGLMNPCCCGNRLAKRTRKMRRYMAAPSLRESVTSSYASGGLAVMPMYTVFLHPLSSRRRNRLHATPESTLGPWNTRSRKANSGVGRMSAHARRMCSTACGVVSLCVSGRPALGSQLRSLSPAAITSSSCGPLQAVPSHGSSWNLLNAVLGASTMNASSSSDGPLVGTGGPVHAQPSATAYHGNGPS